MASIVPGFEYDIFISYRQKDNKGDRWVSEFVAALKTELESTFKEEISVYFDINPHDGLLETHDVNASLKEKLKCLIFIPVISQTYCDPQSFAWQHELVAFNKLAKEDQFGRDICLAGGNVASRILPIKIHDLDAEDKALLEKELGGVLRSIDFIYKASGVNRPLKPNDERTENLNHTYYRDQINKVANSIKEIITAIKKPNQQDRGISREVSKPKPESPKKLKSKIIIASVVVLALIVLGYFIIPRLSNSSKPIEKSIAVLPFRNDSRDSTNQYFINGIMEMITTNLQMVKVLRVVSRTSVEQYRNNKTKSISEIAKELDVNYIIEGSGQKYGNSFSVTTQLIRAKGKETHLWAKTYEQEIKQVNDYIRIESQIAQSIAQELKTSITPEEKQLIGKTPTASLSAYDFYQRGREEHTKFWINNRDKPALQKAKEYYVAALKYDSTFAQAYTGLAMVYWDKHYWQEYFSKNFMDSILILTNIALSFDNQLSEAYTLRGEYYKEIGKPQQSLEEFDKAIKLNPNDWMAYRGKGDLYSVDDNFLYSIDNYQKAASLNHGSELPDLLKDIAADYAYTGFIEIAKHYILEAFKIDGDSVGYLSDLGVIEEWQGNFKKAIEFGVKGYAIDSTDRGILGLLGINYSWLGQYDESLKYWIKYVERLKAMGELSINNMQRIGYTYWQNGYKKEAEYFFNEQIEYDLRMNELKRPYGLYTYYDLAGVYAFREEKDKAYKNLRILDQKKSFELWTTTFMKTDPLFNSIRNEPEFQQIARDIEAKYQAEHQRVRKWLEEQGKL